MADLKFGRKAVRNTTDVDVNDEFYAKLSYGQQTLVCLMEMHGIAVKLSDYQGRKYVSTTSLDEMWKKFGG